MADPTSLVDVATHVGGVAGGGGLMAAVMQWFRTREAREARDALIALQGKVDRLVVDVEKLGATSREVTTTTNSVAAAHRRTDEQDDRLDDHEARLRALEAAPHDNGSRRRHRPK